MSTPENTVLLVYRVIGDRRIPYQIELDSTMTVVVDRPDLEMLRAQTMAATPGMEEATSAAAVAALTAQRGVAQNVLAAGVAAGAIVSTTAPELLELLPNANEGIIAKEKLPGGGNRVTYKPTARDIKVGEWVTSLVEQNPIEGTDELRAEFFAAEAELRASAAAAGKTCKSCDLGALIRKYRAKLEALGHLT